MQPFCTVQQLTATGPLAQAVAVAGWTGRARKVFRIVAAAQAGGEGSLEGAFVLVETGGSHDSEAAMARYVDSAAAGIMVAGRGAALSRRLMDAADAGGVPLFIYHQNIGEQAVAFAFELAAVLAQNGEAARFAEYCRCSRPASVTADLSALLSRLAKYLLNPAVVVDPAFQTLAQGGIAEFLPAADLAGLLKAVRLQMLQRRLADLPAAEACMLQAAAPDGQAVCCHLTPLFSETQHLGHLVVFDPAGTLNELDLCRIDEAAVSCVQGLVSRRNIEEIEKKYKEHFLYDLLYNNFDSEEALIKRGRLWGWEFTRPQRLLIIEPDDFRQLLNKDSILEQLRLSAAAVLQQHFRQAIVSEMQDQVVIIVPDAADDDKSAKQRLKAVARVLQDEMREVVPKVTFSAGIGKFYASAAELCRSYQEAKHALALGRFIQECGHITHFEELGVIRLLSHVNQDQLDDFYKEHLAGLIAYDEKNAANYLETLQVYFQQNGDLNLTAEKLFMHPNTLRYRLKKIEELMDADLQKLETRVSLAVACKIAKMRKT